MIASRPTMGDVALDGTGTFAEPVPMMAHVSTVMTDPDGRRSHHRTTAPNHPRCTERHAIAALEAASGPDTSPPSRATPASDGSPESRLRARDRRD